MNPILIYKADDTCYNILNFMIEELGNALTSLGIEVIYYDPFNKGLKEIRELVGNQFLAQIGFQTTVFAAKIDENKRFLHDYLYGPKMNVFFDHPIFSHEDCLEEVPDDYYILTHDSNYVSFIKNYYSRVKDAFLFPPGGSISKQDFSEKKEDDVIFVGSYVNYRRFLPTVREIIRKNRLAGEYLDCLRADSTLPQEAALKLVLSRNNMSLSDEGFLELFDDFKLIQYMLNAYCREKVVGSLLKAGIDITVFDKGWDEAPFRDNEHVKVKEALTPEEGLEAFSKSKLSLNVMSGHKAGFTERIANSMLNKSVVVSDYSSCLDEQYENGKDLILFRFEELNELPERVRTVIASDSLREEMADRAFKRAYAEDTWAERAKLLIKYLYDISC